MRDARAAGKRRDWDAALAEFPKASHELERGLFETIRDARADGITLKRIGQALGDISPQAVHERYEALRAKFEGTPPS
jgi:hypothetical protein